MGETRVEHNKLKQRLVGAIVLVSLGVIFIPMLLTERGEDDPLFLSSNIPPKPERVAPPTSSKLIETEIKVPELKRVVIDVPTQEAPSEIDEKIVVAKADEPKLVEPEKPVVKTEVPVEKGTTKDDAKYAKRWVVQVGSFGKESNALSLRDRLRKQGFTTFVEAVEGKKGTIYRVRLGPELTVVKAEKLRDKLLKETKLKGLVVQYP